MAIMFSLKRWEGFSTNAADAIEECVLANRILANEGVIDGLGHVSVRNPENPLSFFQSYSLSPELVTKNDILEFDLDGNILGRTDRRPYGERVLHAAVYRARPDVKAISHGHPHSVIPFSSTGVPIRPIAHFASMFYEGIPFFDDYDVSSGMLICTVEEGERLARALGNFRAVVLRDHGCVVVGDCVQTMVEASIYLRDNASLQLEALHLGKPKYLSYEEGRRATEIMECELTVERVWGYWIRRAKKAMPDL